MWSAAFWKATAERVISSAAGGMLAGWAVASSLPAALTAGGIAAAVSLLKALIAAGTGDGGPSLTNSEKLPEGNDE